MTTLPLKTQLLVVALGGGVGAMARHGITLFMARRLSHPFPAGTLVANLLGCLLIGVLMTLVQERAALSEHTRLLLVTGCLGSLTTFSTFGFETLALARGGDPRLALANVAGNLLLGLLAVFLGRKLVELFL